MRQRGASIFVYLIFGVLIAAFVVTLGPTNPDQGGGCGTSSNTVVSVGDAEANLSAYRVAYSNNFNRMRQRGRVYFALETLIRREILAEAAADRGIRVTGDMVDEEIKKGYFFLGGMRIPMGAIIFDEHEDGTRTWNVRKFKNWVAGLDVKSTSTYRDEQTRSMQAALMYELLQSSARVSREEALADFLYSKNTVSYETVTFDPAPYRSAMRLTDADIERFLASHEAEVKARYQADERLYKALKPQLEVRQIFIAKSPDPKPETPTDTPADPPAGAGSAAGSAAPAPKPPEPKKDATKKDAAVKTVGMPIEQAKAKLEAARAAIESGKQKFADAAKQLSTDDAAKANGGDIGWRSVENPQLGDKALNDAVKALEPGKLSPVITTANGAYLFTAEAKREGDLSYDQVKHEIAAKLARETWAKEKAKREAIAALDTARAGTGKNLYDLFEKAPDAGMNLDFLGDPNMSEEQKRMMLEQLRQQMQNQMPKSGSLTIESKDIPVKWHAPDETKGGSAGSAVPAAGGGTGAGTGAGTAAPAPTPTTPPTPGVEIEMPPIEPTKDVLPQFGDVTKPMIESHSMQPRSPVLPGLSKELTPVVFDELSAGMLAKRVYEVDGTYVILQVTNKNTAEEKDFDKDAARYIERLQRRRAYTAAENFIYERCMDLHEKKKISPMKQLVAESDEQGNAAPQIYQPCMYQGLPPPKSPQDYRWLRLMLMDDQGNMPDL